MVRIIQCLCPSRHCIMAMAYEPVDITPEEMLQGFKELVQAATNTDNQDSINPWCGICRSQDWHYEDMATKFQTIEDARPFMEENERAQALARAILGRY